jgi:N-acetylglucosamine-6-sulfatase
MVQPRPAAARAGWALLLLSACGGGGSSPSAPAPVPTPTPQAARPNLVLVVTDDLDMPTTAELPRLPDLMANRGLTFTHAYASQAVCAPSRASILTGQYSHNHGVTSNGPPDWGFVAFRRYESQTLATWLKAAGYRTSLVGKYMNGYASGAGDDYVPPGWDDWFGHLSAIEDGRYINYWTNDNGDVERHGSAPEDYSVDVEAKRAVAFIRASAGRPEPIFLYLAPEAPHTPWLYAERFGSEFRYSLAPRVPSFNESNVNDKPSWVRGIAPMTDADIDRADKDERFRLRSMRAVEEEIDAVIQALAETGRVNNTYILFTSDNGLLMGQHRAVGIKGNPYEESAGVPLMVRGPGVPVGSVDRLVLNVDLAPTLLELAGAAIPDTVDGRSLVSFLRGRPPSDWRTDVLLENYGGGPTYSLRTPEWMYNHQDTEEFELYDMQADPFQVKNLYRKADPALLQSFEQRIKTLVACRGAACRS